MPDLLGVTNAVPGNDANLINRNMPSIPNDPRVQNATDLNRVSRPDNRAERQDAGETGSQAARYDSNFITFLQRMSETPGLARTMAELLRSYQGTRVSSGMEEGIAVEMSALLEMLKMDRVPVYVIKESSWIDDTGTYVGEISLSPKLVAQEAVGRIFHAIEAPQLHESITRYLPARFVETPPIQTGILSAREELRFAMYDCSSAHSLEMLAMIY